MDTKRLRMKELEEISGIKSSNLNRYYKGKDNLVEKSGKRITGIEPQGVEDIFRSRGWDHIYRGGVYIANSQTGGTAKSTSIISLAMAYYRVSNRDKSPIILVDTDSQSSLSLQVLGEINEERSVLIDYVEGRQADIRKLLVEIEKGVFLLPSSLDNTYLERAVGKSPSEVKKTGLKIIKSLFDEFGPRTKIFIDTPPALAAMSHSFLLGALLYESNEEIDRVLTIPIRSDAFSIKGAEIVISEAENLLDTFSISRQPDIIPFLCMFDQRTKNSVTAMKMALENEVISKYELSPIVIKVSSEVTKQAMRNETIYSKGVSNIPVQAEYTDLMLYMMGWSGGVK